MPNEQIQKYTPEEGQEIRNEEERNKRSKKGLVVAISVLAILLIAGGVFAFFVNKMEEEVAEDVLENEVVEEEEVTRPIKDYGTRLEVEGESVFDKEGNVLLTLGEIIKLGDNSTELIKEASVSPDGKWVAITIFFPDLEHNLQRANQSVLYNTKTRNIVWLVENFKGWSESGRYSSVSMHSGHSGDSLSSVMDTSELVEHDNRLVFPTTFKALSDSFSGLTMLGWIGDDICFNKKHYRIMDGDWQVFKEGDVCVYAGTVHNVVTEPFDVKSVVDIALTPDEDKIILSIMSRGEVGGFIYDTETKDLQRWSFSGSIIDYSSDGNLILTETSSRHWDGAQYYIYDWKERSLLLSFYYLQSTDDGINLAPPVLNFLKERGIDKVEFSSHRGEVAEIQEDELVVSISGFGDEPETLVLEVWINTLDYDYGDWPGTPDNPWRIITDFSLSEMLFEGEE